MLNAFRTTTAALSLLLFLALSGQHNAAINWDTPVNKGLSHFSLVATSTAGEEMYAVYCVGCHGKDGRGQTPYARYCAVPPADLSQLTRNNHGIYPAERVSNVLRRGTGQLPRGPGYMPVWEPLLRSMNSDPPGITEVRIQNLTKYVKTLQSRPAPPHRRTLSAQ
ncbi:MAG: c-type cytochrome [Candidatus Acidiferrum sp.]